MRSKPAVDPLADLLGYQLRRVSLLVMVDLATALQPLGLRAVEASILLQVGADTQRTQSDIGRQLGVQRANMTPLVAGLETRGAIRRVVVDGRSKTLALTDVGHALRAAALDAITRHEDRCFAALAPDERADLTRQLRKLWADAA